MSITLTKLPKVSIVYILDRQSFSKTVSPMPARAEDACKVK